MKLSFLAVTSISLAALVSSCGSSNPQDSSGLQASSNSNWVDVTTTDGTRPSTCKNTPANCTMKDVTRGLAWSKRLPNATWYKAKSACLALTHNGQKAGSWRLPTKDELESATSHDARGAAATNWITIEDMEEYFWSGSSLSSGSDSAWIVNLANGYTYYILNKNFNYAVACVQ